MRNTFLTTGLLALSFITANAQNNKVPVYLDDKQPIELCTRKIQFSGLSSFRYSGTLDE